MLVKFLLFVSSRPRYQAEFYNYIERSLFLLLFSFEKSNHSIQLNRKKQQQTICGNLVVRKIT